jgi:phosphoribulokinase
MSAEYPIVAITGASDYSTSMITQALQHIFYRERIRPFMFLAVVFTAMIVKRCGQKY